MDLTLERCFQLMQTEDETLLRSWMDNWDDLVDFEVRQVISSADAAERIAPSCDAPHRR